MTLNCHFNPLSHCWHSLSSGVVSSFPLTLLFLFLLPLSLQFLYITSHALESEQLLAFSTVITVVKTEKQALYPPPPHRPPFSHRIKDGLRGCGWEQHWQHNTHKDWTNSSALSDRPVLPHMEDPALRTSGGPGKLYAPKKKKKNTLMTSQLLE